MPVYIEKSGDLVGCYHSGTDGQTTEQGEIELLSQWTIDDWDEQYGNEWRREPKFALDILWNMFTGKFTLVAQWLANLRLDCPALTLVVGWANSKQIPFIECSTTYLQNTAKLMKVKHGKDWRGKRDWSYYDCYMKDRVRHFRMLFAERNWYHSLYPKPFYHSLMKEKRRGGFYCCINYVSFCLKLPILKDPHGIWWKDHL